MVSSFRQRCESCLRGRKRRNDDKELYQTYLKSHLLQFIDTQCGGCDNCIFWPGLGSSHYATDVQTWFNFGEHRFCEA